MVLSVDRHAFTPGLPEEGKVVILSVDLGKPARTTLEVLDQFGRPLATILHNRRRSVGEHHILGLYAAGWTEHQILESYPTLTPEALRAIFAFSAECMREEALYAIPAAN